ncbi:NAD(P)/FAD-dependent oxidoreductase [Pararhizobium sp. IMCC21322]|uniref:flavin-containing monooxygenase n=1 Tax=Pararhizobium sp. IMCC21322 TaxID=3067903 RepID=UPI00274167EF|nr:NAD(P)/FAD-dependent oxidoreductase [Pararhizobium sp. IMCC21322]
MQTTQENETLVIGAGLSGLATARALKKRGLSVTILEAQNRVAEPWRNRHPALRLNIHRHFVRLPGQEAPREDGPFLKRDTVVAHLERYATHLDVPIRFGARVTGIERSPTGWQVTTTAGIFLAAHVVFATGRDSNPYSPDWPGRETFEGELLHAADLGDASRFDGKRVLVVGAGNSGSDVLNHLARHRPAEVLISVRHGPAVVPTRIFGLPLHRLARVFAALPLAIVDPAFRITQRLFLGNLERYGLKSHPDGSGTRLVRDGVAFAIDDGYIAELKSGRFRVVSGVERFERTRIHLTDGTSFHPDVVIAATGYRNGLAPLLAHLGALDESGQPRHPMGESDPDNPGLWFTGFRPIFTGYFDAAGIAADRIANGVAAALHGTVTEYPSNKHDPSLRRAVPRRAATLDAPAPTS